MGFNPNNFRRLQIQPITLQHFNLQAIFQPITPNPTLFSFKEGSINLLENFFKLNDFENLDISIEEARERSKLSPTLFIMKHFSECSCSPGIQEKFPEDLENKEYVFYTENDRFYMAIKDEEGDTDVFEIIDVNEEFMLITHQINSEEINTTGDSLEKQSISELKNWLIEYSRYEKYHTIIEELLEKEKTISIEKPYPTLQQLIKKQNRKLGQLLLTEKQNQESPKPTFNLPSVFENSFQIHPRENTFFRKAPGTEPGERNERGDIIAGWQKEDSEPEKSTEVTRSPSPSLSSSEDD